MNSNSTIVVVTISGGGERAASLGLGALEALADIVFEQWRHEAKTINATFMNVDFVEVGFDAVADPDLRASLPRTPTALSLDHGDNETLKALGRSQIRPCLKNEGFTVE